MLIINQFYKRFNNYWRLSLSLFLVACVFSGCANIEEVREDYREWRADVRHAVGLSTGGEAGVQRRNQDLFSDQDLVEEHTRRVFVRSVDPTNSIGGGGVRLNHYGLGVGMDQYGRAVPHDPHLQVTPNAYGLGVGMDQYGRPVAGNNFIW